MGKSAYEIFQSKFIGEIGLETTNQCNLRCSYCFNESSIKNEDHMSIKTIVRIIDEAKNIIPVPTITFSGGEFFLYKFWEQALENIAKTNVPFKIITNGTLLTDIVIKKLSKYRLGLLQISIDGSIEKENILRGSGNVETIIESLKIIAAYPELKKVTVIRMTVSKVNIDTLVDSIKFFNSLGYHVRMGYLFSMGRGIKSPYLLNTQDIYKLHTMLYKLKEISSLDFDMPVLAIYAPCNLIEKNIPLNVRIKANGEIFACFGVESCGFKLGNINTDSLAEILKGSNLLKAIEFMLERYERMSNGDCKQCVAKNICKGGCLGHSLYENDNAYQPPKRLCIAADLFSRGLLIKNRQEDKLNVK